MKPKNLDPLSAYKLVTGTLPPPPRMYDIPIFLRHMEKCSTTKFSASDSFQLLSITNLPTSVFTTPLRPYGFTTYV